MQFDLSVLLRRVEGLPPGALVGHPTILLKTSSYAKDGRRKIYLSLYSKHFLTIASGATTIGSVGRAPDEIF
jgi:hypothetical protein